MRLRSRQVEDPQCVKWTFWRGTPEHVAQIARVAMESLSGESSATCHIDVEVPPYRQTFPCSGFADRITPEALRDFRRICIRGRNSSLRIDVLFRRKIGRTRTFPVPPFTDGEVVLLVRPTKGSTGPDRQVMRRMRTAVDRGRVRWGGFGDRIAVYACLFAPLLVANFTLLWLTASQPVSKTSRYALLAWGPLYILALFLVTYLLLWVRPTVEVAPLGETRLWEVVRRGGPWVAGIIAAGIAKLAFG